MFIQRDRALGLEQNFSFVAEKEGQKKKTLINFDLYSIHTITYV